MMEHEKSGIYSIRSINSCPPEEKGRIYSRLIPDELLGIFQIRKEWLETPELGYLILVAPSGSSSVEMKLHHEPEFPDPILYGHLTDTLNGQIHVLLYILNDPSSPRFDVDRLPDGTSTIFGTRERNLEAERAALECGLAPGQIRKGLRLLGPAIQAFEAFVTSLGHEMYFAEPLYYHNAVIFERYGFAYEKGRRLMERIQRGFSQGGDLIPKLDDPSGFRRPDSVVSIRLRSWAIHDNILGEPFTNVTMYKRVGKMSGVNTCGDCSW